MIGDHVCWAYDDVSGFEAYAETFLAAGLAAGHQVWYVAEAEAPLVGRLRVADPDAVRFVSLVDNYSPDATADPDASARLYADATAAALAAGYAGLRVAADVTSLVRTPDQLDAFARYEHLADRLIRTRPYSAVCGYARAELGDEAIAQIACLHAATNAAVPFRLHAADPAEAAVELTGELDSAGHELLRAALDRTDLRPSGGRLVVRADGLTFVDHRSLIMLGRYAADRSAVAVLRGAPPAARRIATLLDLPALTVESAA